MKTALLAGATGLIGKELLNLLLEDARYGRVIAVTRRSLGINHPKLEEHVMDLGRLPEWEGKFKADDVFCCLGSTMAQAGSRENFRKVDFDYPLALARLGLASGAHQYFLVSSLGAKASSLVFYNKVKGEVEGNISKLGYECLHIFRPSMLLGFRKELRVGEESAKFFFRLFNVFIPMKYKPIEADQVAFAMQQFAHLDQKGIYIHESDELQKF